jgi:tetratricopeptide (TPR) repeat protein
VTIVAWFAQTRVPTMLARRSFARLARQVNAEDVKGARVTLLELREVYLGSRAAMEQLRLYEAQLLSLERKHAHAAKLLASVDTKVLAKAWAPVLWNNLAWYRVLSGDASNALTAARTSLELSDETTSPLFSGGTDLRGLQLGTLGAALAITGDAEHASEAIEKLEQSLARGGSKKHQAAREFFLGEALSVLGREDDARAAYARAVEEAPDSELAERATERLKGKKAYRA